MVKKEPKPTAPTTSRFSRFAKLTSMAAGMAARTIKDAVAESFQDDEQNTRMKSESLRKSAESMTKTLGDLKGAAMKVGQMLATDPELLPPEMRAEVQKLQRQAPAMPFNVVKTAVETALGMPLDDAFVAFAETPVGAASIGQVHRATLHPQFAIDGISEVAVKVQYPGIASTIDSDMKNLGGLLNVARAYIPKARLDEYVREITDVIRTESDYLREAKNLARFQDIVDRRTVRVPRPVNAVTRGTVLVMEFLDAVPLSTWLETAGDDEKSIIGERLLHAYLDMIHVHGLMHADAHPGNYVVFPRDVVDGAPVLGILDAGCTREYDLSFTDHLIDVLNAMWRHDVDALMKASRALGCIDEGVDPDSIYEWLSFVLEPIMHDRVFDFGQWKLQDQAVVFMKDHPTLKKWAPPRELLFYLRTLSGLRGLFFKTGMKLNVHRVARAVAANRGRKHPPLRGTQRVV
jgi:predicted unusual protein kinase regulating ubiquinone biosynthesis (AarF/ABC1/UbiB family)